MTKKGLLLAASLLAFVLPLVPTASAHGAPGAREIDTRLLLDADGLAFLPGQCTPDPLPVVCPLDDGGADLLALEVREARAGDGEPVVWFRVIFQSEETHSDRYVDLTLTAGGATKTFRWKSIDGLTYNGDFDDVSGPFDVGDGHPKAVDGMVRYSTLGVQAGEQLSGITLTSGAAGVPSDLMPGTYFVHGTEAPATPNEEGEIPDATPGSYTLAGPATLVTATRSENSITLTNTLNDTPQFVTLKVDAPLGVRAEVTPDAVNLDPKEASAVTFKVTVQGLGGLVNVTAISDYGAWSRFQFEVQPDVTMTCPTGSTVPTPTTPHTGHGDAHPVSECTATTPSTPTDDGHDHEHDDGKDSPGVGLALLMAALAVAFVSRRSAQ